MNKLIILYVVFLLTPFSPVFAACVINGKEVPCSEFPWWIFVILFVVGITVFVFWLKMLIHAIKNPISNKAIWIIALIIFQFIAAVIYYFTVKKKMNVINPQ